jgi:pyruvate-ferredoxin/flavodoxin oxidoreductase
MKLAHAIRKDNQTLQWIIGGDGWAYDIGFGGVDHVLSSGMDINLLVLDTECYSNTGGQASKATPLGSAAKFAAGGKRTSKKDLAGIAMTYSNVYVACVALGADMEQTVKAFKEAAAYPGPSLIIAYATCISHGLTSGMGSSMHEEKKAVDAGYVNLFRYNPSLITEGKNPLIIDSKPPQSSYKEFLDGENRYRIIAHDHPEDAENLFRQAWEDALKRYNKLVKMKESFEP